MTNAESIASRFEALQQHICSVLNKADGQTQFKMFPWTKDIGSGTSAVIQNGAYIEKGAVNFSHVKGKFNERMEKLLGEKASYYEATGVSSILHPQNVHVPIIHMNVRYFKLDNGTHWFGGGLDLTPHYIDKEDARTFHSELRKVCDRFYPDFYPRFKTWADDYFFNTHRNETRGIGGIFFDRVKPGEELSEKELLDFCIQLGELYPQVYATLMLKNGNKPETAEEKSWQALRRGRYVEFNLVYDRGTKFGLESGGNTESILLSMPPNAHWEYMHNPVEGSKEKATLALLKKGIDWINA